MKKPSYTIKTLSIALLVTGSALLNFGNLQANPKRIEKAILVFHEHSTTPEPKMSWSDLIEIEYQLLRETEFKDGAESLKRLKDEKRANVVGVMLKNISRKLPEAMQKAIQAMQARHSKDELTRRFNASIAKARLAEAELKTIINELLKS